MNQSDIKRAVLYGYLHYSDKNTVNKFISDYVFFDNCDYDKTKMHSGQIPLGYVELKTGKYTVFAPSELFDRVVYTRYLTRNAVIALLLSYMGCLTYDDIKKYPVTLQDSAAISMAINGTNNPSSVEAVEKYSSYYDEPVRVPLTYKGDYYHLFRRLDPGHTTMEWHYLKSIYFGQTYNKFLYKLDCLLRIYGAEATKQELGCYSRLRRILVSYDKIYKGTKNKQAARRKIAETLAYRIALLHSHMAKLAELYLYYRAYSCSGFCHCSAHVIASDGRDAALAYLAAYQRNYAYLKKIADLYCSDYTYADWKDVFDTVSIPNVVCDSDAFAKLVTMNDAIVCRW